MSAVVAGAADVAYLLLGLALLVAFERLRRGPTLADRVVALDLTAFVLIGLMAVHALATGATAFLDAAMILALVAFLGTLAFARHIERGEPRPPDRSETP